MRSVYAAVVVGMLFVLSGCATIASGTTQKVSVSSQPSGADAKADGTMSGKTPTTFTLDRKSEHTIEISMDGYKKTTVMIKKAFNGMTTGNILVGGIIGAGVDAASGAMNKLIPERVDVVLEPGAGDSAQPKFVAEADQEYYEKNILKAGTDLGKKTPSSGGLQNVPVQIDQRALRKSVQDDADMAVGSKTNFGPKTQ